MPGTASLILSIPTSRLPRRSKTRSRTRSSRFFDCRAIYGEPAVGTSPDCALLSVREQHAERNKNRREAFAQEIARRQILAAEFWNEESEQHANRKHEQGGGRRNGRDQRHRCKQRCVTNTQAAAEIDELVCRVDPDDGARTLFEESQELPVIGGNEKDGYAENTLTYEGPEGRSQKTFLDGEIFKEHGRERDDEGCCDHQKQQPQLEMLSKVAAM